jgi:biopolymer transport protein ExbD
LLRFEPSDLASYDTSAKTIALIKDAGAEKFAFIGNERHGDFAR